MPRKMFSIRGKVSLLVCLPVTRELQVVFAGKILKLQWLTYEQTAWRVTVKDRDLADYLIVRLRQQTEYQRERFHIGASSHRWIWFYEEGIPLQVRSLNYNTELLDRRITTQFLPEDYGSEAMDIFIHSKLKKRESEFMRDLPLKAFVGTWNCAGDAPRESVVQWLRGQNSAESEPDMLVIGLQEACELTATKMLGDPERIRDWVGFLGNEVRSAYQASYIMIIQKDLVGLLLAVFVQEKHHPHVNYVEVAAIKLGFRGFVGNKGAVVARFNLYDSTLFIANCHFQAHAGKLYTEYVTYRNENFKNVVKLAKFKVRNELVSMHEHE